MKVNITELDIAAEVLQALTLKFYNNFSLCSFHKTLGCLRSIRKHIGVCRFAAFDAYSRCTAYLFTRRIDLGLAIDNVEEPPTGDFAGDKCYVHTKATEMRGFDDGLIAVDTTCR